MNRVCLAVLTGLMMVGCNSPTTPAIQRSYWAPLKGTEEVPPNASIAVGQAVFRLNTTGTALTYELVSQKIDNVTMAHIHIGAAGTNGPIVQFLYGVVPSGGGPVTADPLSTGTIDGSQFVGPLAGRPFSELIAAIDAGNAYVNVHTNDGVAPTTNLPGDIPGGEVRGQIRLVQ